MAMTKREQAAYDAAIKAAETVAALRWTEPVEPDVPVPTNPDYRMHGWSCDPNYPSKYGSMDGCVYEMWSERYAHGRDGHEEHLSLGIAYQGGIPLYSTKLRALLAVRHEVEKLMAERLQSIDLLIRAAQQPQPQEQDTK